MEGHTDAAGFSSLDGYSNWELSADRANAARRTMERSGVDAGRVVEVRGYADRHPRVAGDPFNKSNRRISILLPFTTGPTGDAGDSAPATASAPRAAPATGAS
jgi:chemotaxis protein MotB